MRLFSVKLAKPLEDALASCRPHLLAAASFSALINILYLAPTIYMMQVYDRVVPTGGISTLMWVTALVAIALATLAALDAVRSHLMMRVSLRINRLLAGDILDRLMSRSKVKADEPATRQAMREFDVLRNALGGQAATAMFDAPWAPLYLIVACMLHPVLGGIVLLAAAILVALAVINERRTKEPIDHAHAAQGSAYAAQETIVANAEVVRALGMRRSLVARSLSGRGEGLRAAAEVQFAGSRYNSLVKFFRMFMQSLALGVGAWLAINGQISVGAIIAASVLLSRALAPIEQLVGAWSTIGQARMALKTLNRLFDDGESIASKRTALPEPEGHLKLDRVVVRNEDGTALLLKNVSLDVAPGQILGVIGPSGAGKSTLARVASGAVVPDLGEARIDGAKFDDWDPEELALRIGYLPQDSALLPGTISENISRFANERGVPQPIVDQAVIEAAQLAGVHQMILDLAQGYQTTIGQHARRLSAGQAQRIALARAVYGRPKILVLDEPNSALDAEGEEALSRAIAALKVHGSAIIIVAHRASILASADNLLVMQDGQVAQIGSRQEVMDDIRTRAAQVNVVPIREGAKP